MNANDENSIQILLKIARICGTFPPEKPSKWIYIYHIFTFAITLFISVISMYFNAIELYSRRDTIDVFVNVLASFFTTVQGLSIQLLTLTNPNGWRQLYEKLDCKQFLTSRKMWVYFEIFAIQALFFLKLSFATWTWLSVGGYTISIKYFYRHLYEHYAIISIAIIVHVNLIIKRKFFAMNSILLKRNNDCIRNVQKIHREIVDIIEIFNGVFGYQILFIMAHTIVVMLENANNFMKSNVFNDAISLKVFLWSAFYGFQVIVILNDAYKTQENIMNFIIF